jgi:hypothetical protein
MEEPDTLVCNALTVFGVFAPTPMTQDDLRYMLKFERPEVAATTFVGETASVMEWTKGARESCTRLRALIAEFLAAEENQKSLNETEALGQTAFLQACRVLL